MADRVACCVPFCRRTTRGEDRPFEWVCGPHWRAVPKELRRTRSAVYRAYRRQFGENAFWHYPPGSAQRIACLEVRDAWIAAWTAARDAAIERAAGIL